MAVKSDLPAIPAALADVALIEGPVAAAAAGMSISQWNGLVARGIAPAPAIRRPRYTRFRLADVRRFLIESAQGSNDVASAVSMGKAKKASDAARAKRDADRQASA